MFMNTAHCPVSNFYHCKACHQKPEQGHDIDHGDFNSPAVTILLNSITHKHREPHTPTTKSSTVALQREMDNNIHLPERRAPMILSNGRPVSISAMEHSYLICMLFVCPKLEANQKRSHHSMTWIPRKPVANSRYMSNTWKRKMRREN